MSITRYIDTSRDGESNSVYLACAVLDILSGVVCICTLGYVRLSLTLPFLFWVNMRRVG